MVLAVLVTPQALLTLLTFSDTCKRDTRAPSLMYFRDPFPRGSQVPVVDIGLQVTGLTQTLPSFRFISVPSLWSKDYVQAHWGGH